jgi:radical SAM protein with 4Fe4S-binding SPASM domain
LAALELEIPLSLRFDHAVHLVDGRYLVIAPDLATFFATDRLGLALFEEMKAGVSPIDAILKHSAPGALPFVFAEMLELLSQLSRASLLAPEAIMDERTRPNPSLHLYVTDACNLACVHCYRYDTPVRGRSHGRASEALSEAEITRLLDDYTAINPEGNIVVSGGEPFLRPDIYRILARARALGHHSALFTNGTLVDQAVAAALAGLVDVVQVSLDGATEGVNDRIRGPGAYQKALQAIHLLSDAGVAVDIAVTLNPDNVGDLLQNHETLEQLARAGHCKTVRVAVVKSIGRARSTWPGLDRPCLERSAQTLLELFIKAGITHEVPPAPKIRYNCGFGPGFHVDWQGDVYPCREEERFRLANIRLEPLGQIYGRIYRQYLETSIEHMPECRGCDLRYICTGGCRIANLQATGSYTAPVCTDETRQAIYRKMAFASARLTGRIERRESDGRSETRAPEAGRIAVQNLREEAGKGGGFSH